MYTSRVNIWAHKKSSFSSFSSFNRMGLSGIVTTEWIQVLCEIAHIHPTNTSCCFPLGCILSIPNLFSIVQHVALFVDRVNQAILIWYRFVWQRCFPYQTVSQNCSHAYLSICFDCIWHGISCLPKNNVLNGHGSSFVTQSVMGR